jgi:hypothetical protein
MHWLKTLTFPLDFIFLLPILQLFALASLVLNARFLIYTSHSDELIKGTKNYFQLERKIWIYIDLQLVVAKFSLITSF